MEHCCLNSEYQSFLDQFINFRIQYCAIKKTTKAKEELIRLQNMELEAANKRLDTLLTTFSEYQKRYSANINHLEGENHQLTKCNQELEERCRLLQKNNHDYLDSINQSHNEQIQRLEEDIEILQSKIALQNSAHNEELIRLEKNYKDQVDQREKIISDLNFKVANLQNQLAKGNHFSHPAFHDNSKRPLNTVGKKAAASSPAFNRWPNLNVQRSGQKTDNTNNEPTKKKKKLYMENDGEVVDIV